MHCQKSQSQCVSKMNMVNVDYSQPKMYYIPFVTDVYLFTLGQRSEKNLENVSWDLSENGVPWFSICLRLSCVELLLKTEVGLAPRELNTILLAVGYLWMFNGVFQLGSQCNLREGLFYVHRRCRDAVPHSCLYHGHLADSVISRQTANIEVQDKDGRALENHKQSLYKYQ